MTSYDRTLLWQTTLGPKLDAYEKEGRSELREAYERVRRRAEPLAATIQKDLPDFTVHDITHSDALWDCASLILGPSYTLNPCEAFVLGCAFLIHDLGMAMAAYVEGIDKLKTRDFWKDAVARQLRKRGALTIDDAAIKNPGKDIEDSVLEEALRQLHAEQSEKLPLIHFPDPTTGEKYFLIEDANYRDAFGSVIGRIAYSHWWPVDRLAKEFPKVSGAPARFPSEWTVDALKLACILRCADYVNIDERRAPIFVRALRKPKGDSDDHWLFQGRLYQPSLEGDRILFSSKRPFTVDEASAWWVCFDTIRGIDTELRKVDALLSDKGRDRFLVRGVAQSDEPSRLAEVILTSGWQPVDARIQVSAVADLVGKLGGADLYGDSITPPLRELIQNAADAIRARRILDSRPPDWGEVKITFGEDELGDWIAVEDKGVGMSQAVLTGPLLDFGTSFWTSSLVHDQLPGLNSKSFSSTGRYGIGFFSVFMWGDMVEVTTQKYNESRSSTLVLSFKKGLKERPILRSAQPSEYILDGGTRVKIWFKNPEIICKLLDAYNDEIESLTIAQACARLAPCVDATILTEGPDEALSVSVSANDWLTINDESLLRRIAPFSKSFRTGLRAKAVPSITHPPLTLIKDSDGHIYGRAALWVSDAAWHPNAEAGIVTVGGFHACDLQGIVGVLLGNSQKASRDAAIPQVPISVLKDWVNKERDARLSENHPPEILLDIASLVRRLGCDTGILPIAESKDGFVNPTQIFHVIKDKSEILLVQDYSVSNAKSNLGKFTFHDNVFSVGMGTLVTLQIRHAYSDWPKVEEFNVSNYRYKDRKSMETAIIEIAADAWNTTPEAIIELSSFNTDFEEFPREIGTFAGQPFTDTVQIIRRPLP